MTLDELRASVESVDGVLRFPEPYRQMSITLEEAEWLYALVRMVRPRRVLELGTGHGVSARFMAEALAENDDDAFLMTQEPDVELRDHASTMLAGLPAASTGIIFNREDQLVDLVFIDSGYQTRGEDIAYWLSGDYAGLVVVHDANRGYAELALGHGVLLPCVDGMWIGRAGGA